MENVVAQQLEQSGMCTFFLPIRKLSKRRYGVPLEQRGFRRGTQWVGRPRREREFQLSNTNERECTDKTNTCITLQQPEPQIKHLPQIRPTWTFSGPPMRTCGGCPGSLVTGTCPSDLHVYTLKNARSRELLPNGNTTVTLR